MGRGDAADRAWASPRAGAGSRGYRLWQPDVCALQRGELRQRLRRRQAGAAAVQQMFQGDPERVPEKRDEEMCLDAPLTLMEHRGTCAVTKRIGLMSKRFSKRSGLEKFRACR